MLDCAVRSRITSASRWRKLASPSISNIRGIEAPVRASISWSESMKVLSRRLARARPMVVLPAPIRPTRKILSTTSSHPSRAPDAGPPSLLQRHLVVDDLRSQEDQQLSLVVGDAGG